jgi:hypothetical protein
VISDEIRKTLSEYFVNMKQGVALVIRSGEHPKRAGQKNTVEKGHIFSDYSTRRHYSGRHGVEIYINGTSVDRPFLTSAVKQNLFNW